MDYIVSWLCIDKTCLIHTFLKDERAGNLTIVLNDPTNIVNMKAQITLLVRGNYSNPPAHGARIVSAVLNDKQLYNEW